MYCRGASQTLAMGFPTKEACLCGRGRSNITMRLCFQVFPKLTQGVKMCLPLTPEACYNMAYLFWFGSVPIGNAAILTDGLGLPVV